MRGVGAVRPGRRAAPRGGPDDHGGHVPGAGRNVFGGHLVDAPVAEDALDYGRADIVRYRGS